RRSEYAIPLQFFMPDVVIATTVLVPLTKFGPPESPKHPPGSASSFRNSAAWLPALLTEVVAISRVPKPVGIVFGSSPSSPEPATSTVETPSDEPSTAYGAGWDGTERTAMSPNVPTIVAGTKFDVFGERFWSNVP